MKPLLLSSFMVCLVMIFGVVGKADFKENYVIHYTFDKDEEDEVTDSSGNDNHGALKNGVKIGDGKFGAGAEFPGGSAHIETMVDVPEHNFTMALWMNTDFSNVGVCSVLEQAAGGGGHDRHFFLVGNKINFRTWQGGAWPTNAIVADGEWHHIALVVESDVGQTAHVDGEQVGTNAYDHSDFDWQDRVWLGFSNDAATDYYTGLIDEFAYLDKPLTDDEVEDLMRSGGVAVDSLDKLATTWGGIKEE
jgi:hypothetical protein